MRLIAPVDAEDMMGLWLVNIRDFSSSYDTPGGRRCTVPLGRKLRIMIIGLVG
jgi:hypothetical protein